MSFYTSPYRRNTNDVQELPTLAFQDIIDIYFKVLVLSRMMRMIPLPAQVRLYSSIGMTTTTTTTTTSVKISSHALLQLQPVSHSLIASPKYCKLGNLKCI